MLFCQKETVSNLRKGWEAICQPYTWVALSQASGQPPCLLMLQLQVQPTLQIWLTEKAKTAKEIWDENSWRILNGHLPLYHFEVPVMHQKTHATTFEEIAVLLPHEVVAAILTWNKDCPRLFEISGMTQEQQQQFLTKCRNFQLDSTSTMPLGFWADGCPVKWDRSESIIVISLNFPGQTLDKYQRIRIPLCALQLNKSYYLFSSSLFFLFPAFLLLCHAPTS